MCRTRKETQEGSILCPPFGAESQLGKIRRRKTEDGSCLQLQLPPSFTLPCHHSAVEPLLRAADQTRVQMVEIDCALCSVRGRSTNVQQILSSLFEMSRLTVMATKALVACPSGANRSLDPSPCYSVMPTSHWMP